MTSSTSRAVAPASLTAVSSTRLADGRELLYFDDDTSPQRRRSEDSRELPRGAPQANSATTR